MNFKEIGEESTLVVDNDVDQPKKARKRIRNSAEWSSNVQKRLKYAGMAYVLTTGKEKSAKAIGPRCAESCALKCSTHLKK